MTPALWAAKTGLDAQQLRMAIISNNLANADTNGFKAGRAVFEDLVYQNMRQAGGLSSQQTELPSGVNIGTGVRIVSTEKRFTQGSLVQTGGVLDVGVEGRGFFEVLQPDGSIGYTRDGSFKLNSEGEMVSSSGYPLQPGITIPEGAQSITIGSDGVVSAQLVGQPAPVQVGSITLTDFINPSGLQAEGHNLYTETAASGAPQQGTPGENGLGSLAQNSLETSNVNIVEELVSMIEAQRAYEMSSRAISTTDEMLQFVTNNL
jgi:flagellar basal-body rod protein FlgG